MSSPQLWHALNWLLAHEKAGLLSDNQSGFVRGIRTNTTTVIDATQVSRLFSVAEEEHLRRCRPIWAKPPETMFDDPEEVGYAFNPERYSPQELNELRDAAGWLDQRGLLLCPWSSAIVLFDGPDFYTAWFVEAGLLATQASAEVWFNAAGILGPRRLGPERDWHFEELRLAFAIASFRGQSVTTTSANRVVRRRLAQVADVAFRTISVAFMHQVTASIGAKHKGARCVRKHKVRGHPVYYERPIGGRANGFTGVTWRRPHERGSAEVGQVVSDYALNYERSE